MPRCVRHHKQRRAASQYHNQHAGARPAPPSSPCRFQQTNFDMRHILAPRGEGEKPCRTSFAFHNCRTIITSLAKVEASLVENRDLSPSWWDKNERPREAKKMKTRRQLTASPSDQRSASVAKQDPAVTALAEARLTRRRSSGWDPYEVWRTRVKGDEEHTAADDTEAPAA